MTVIQLTKRAMAMRSFATALFIIAAASIFVGGAQADPVLGSISVESSQVTVNGTSLSNSTLFTPSNPVLFDGTGDFAAIADDTAVTSSVLNLNNLTGYTVSTAGFGTWVTTSGSFELINPNLLGISLLGTFTPDFGGFTAAPAKQFIAIVRFGRGYLWSGTIESPDLTIIPEPAPIALIGIGLAGLALIRRKRTRA